MLAWILPASLRSMRLALSGLFYSCIDGTIRFIFTSGVSQMPDTMPQKY